MYTVESGCQPFPHAGGAPPDRRGQQLLGSGVRTTPQGLEVSRRDLRRLDAAGSGSPRATVFINGNGEFWRPFGTEAHRRSMPVERVRAKRTFGRYPPYPLLQTGLQGQIDTGPATS